MILIIGSTGTTGSAVLSELVKRGIPSRALIRPLKGRAVPRLQSPTIEYVEGDASSAESLAKALVGVSRVFLSMANGPEQRSIELQVIRESSRAGVEHIVKLSAPIVGDDVPVRIARMHYEIEQAIESSGMAFTHIRPYGFMQNLFSLLPTIHGMGLIFGTSGDTRMNFIDARDIAAVSVHSLLNESCRGNAYQLTGPQAISYPQIAAMLSGLGRPVRYVNQTPEKFRLGLRRAKLAPWLVEHIVEIQALAIEYPETPSDTVAELLGRPPRSLDSFVAENRERFRGPFRLGRLAVRLLGPKAAQPPPIS